MPRAFAPTTSSSLSVSFPTASFRLSIFRPVQDLIAKAATLLEALPYIQR
jgi:hypothetical protein